MHSIERSPSSKQGGFAAVMLLILLGLFLTFAAFALDLGNYYLWKLRMDKIARAAVSAGLGRRALDGFAATNSNQPTATAAMTQVIDESFNSYGIVADADGTPPYRLITVPTIQNDVATVGVEYRAPMIILDKITRALGYGFNAEPNNEGNERRFASGYPWVSSTHSATLSPTNVVLLLDVSGSMLCPATGSCACRRTNTCPARNPLTTPITNPDKLDLMVQGVSNFASMFNPNRDRIAVIPFNLAAQRLYSFTEGGQTGGPALLANQSPSLNNIVNTNVGFNADAYTLLTNPGFLDSALRPLAGSNTNHCDALAEGILELENLSTALYGAAGLGSDRRRLKPFVVFFTDGAPNAMRGIFGANTFAAPANCSTYQGGSTYTTPPVACATQDMYHYALEWVHNENGTPQQYRGPGPFVIRNTTTPGGFIPTTFQHTISGTAVAPLNAPVCGQHSPNPRLFEQMVTTSTAGGAGGRGNAATGCLPGPTFNFAIPYTNVRNDWQGGATATYQATVQNVPISTNNTSWQDPNWPPSFFALPPPPNNYGIQKYDELPYYCAIEAADFMRNRYGATIFTIGLGPAAVHDNVGGSNANTCNDPMQDADDHVGRKDFFLARLAFSGQMFQDAALPVTVPAHYQFKGVTNTPVVTSCSVAGVNNTTNLHRFNTGTITNLPNLQVGYTSATNLEDGANTFRDLRPPRQGAEDAQNPVRRIDTQGEYFPTNIPAQIPVIFGNIAKKILLRAIS